MSKYIKVGSGGGEVTWHRAMLDMEPGDYLLLEPGYYVWPRGRLLEDVTIKGLGASPPGSAAFSPSVKTAPGWFLKT